MFSTEVFSKALKNSYFSVGIYINNKLIGFGRVISDGAMYAWVQDMIIHPEYQQKGFGTIVVKRILDKLRKDGIPFVGLFSAEGKKEFYFKNGFRERPENAPGMYIDLFEKYKSIG